MDRYTKIILTGILLVLISIAAKDVDLFPIAEAQQGWEIENEIAMMDGSMQILPEGSGQAYICRTRIVPRSTTFGDHGNLWVLFYTEPQCMGNQVASGYMFSDGATSSWSDDRYLLSENQLLFFADATARAADTGQRVSYLRCASDKLDCIKYIQFRGDPTEVAD